MCFFVTVIRLSFSAAGFRGIPGNQGPLPIPVRVPGERGLSGPQGIKGPEGVRGESGPQGPPGDTGKSF